MSHTDVLFRDLHADDLPEITEIESLCPNCHDDGITKLLLTKIPFFREVIVASFSCDECGYHNTSIDSAGRYQDKGVKFKLTLLNTADMNRRIVLNKNSVLSIPELDSSFPISEGALTTVEGALSMIIDNINELQDARREVSPELAEQLEQFVNKLKELMTVKKEFIIELADPSGNSIIENYLAPKPDSQLIVQHYTRSQEENALLGIDESEIDHSENMMTYVEEATEEFKAANEVMFIMDYCANCKEAIECRMKVLDIPHFKEVIVMASTCDHCGVRENQIVGGCGIADKAQRITLKINEPTDLARDFLKSDSAGIYIPELDLEANTGTLSGRFTTVEGILMAIAEQLPRLNAFMFGDSANESSSESRINDLISKVKQIASGEMFGVTLVINDPAGNSYIQDIYSPDIDPCLTIEHYDRTAQENEELGLDTMKTEDY